MNLTLVAFLYTFHHFATAIESNHVPKVHAVYIYWLLQTFANILHRKKKKSHPSSQKKQAPALNSAVVLPPASTSLPLPFRLSKCQRDRETRVHQPGPTFVCLKFCSTEQRSLGHALAEACNIKKSTRKIGKKASANSLDIPRDTG